MSYANAAGRENIIAGINRGLGGRVHPQIAWAKLKAPSEGVQSASRARSQPHEGRDLSDLQIT